MRTTALTKYQNGINLIWFSLTKYKPCTDVKNCSVLLLHPYSNNLRTYYDKGHTENVVNMQCMMQSKRSKKELHQACDKTLLGHVRCSDILAGV